MNVTAVRVQQTDDPITRGRCGPAAQCNDALRDFMDLQLDPQGLLWMVGVDACTGACATDPKATNNDNAGYVATVPGLRAYS